MHKQSISVPPMSPDQMLKCVNGKWWIVCVHCGVVIGNECGFTAHEHADDCPVQVAAVERIRAAEARSKTTE